MAVTAPGEYVTIKNVSDKEFGYLIVDKFHLLAPGESRIVPWDHFAHVMGDPFIMNLDRNKDREREYQRVQLVNGPDMLEAYDADGDRLYGIIEDREGSNAPVANQGDALDPAQLRAQLDAMARRQAVLEDLIKVHERATPNESIDTPEDPAPPIQSAPRPDIKGLEPVETITSPDASIPEDSPSKPPVARNRRSSNS